MSDDGRGSVQRKNAAQVREAAPCEVGEGFAVERERTGSREIPPDISIVRHDAVRHEVVGAGNSNIINLFNASVFY